MLDGSRSAFGQSWRQSKTHPPVANSQSRARGRRLQVPMSQTSPCLGRIPEARPSKSRLPFLSARQAQVTKTDLRKLLRKPSAADNACQVRRSVCGIRDTANMSRGKPVSCVAAPRPKRIIFVLPNLARSDAKSATNTPSRFVASTIASCTTMATRFHGRLAAMSTRFRSRSNFGAAHARAPLTPALFLGPAVTPLDDGISELIR
jgi:hypothetical protein